MNELDQLAVAAGHELADPLLDETPSAIYVHDQGQQWGPFSQGDVYRALKEGRLTRSAQARWSSVLDWHPVGVLVPLPPDPPADWQRAARARPRPNRAAAVVPWPQVVVVGFAIGVALTVAFTVFAIMSRPSKPKGPHKFDDDDAIALAQQAVLRRLKAPSTASFPWSHSEYTVAQYDSGKWRVLGYVDSQNGFGAMLRLRWTVTMRPTVEDRAIIETVEAVEP
jgi:hypothetical protein